MMQSEKLRRQVDSLLRVERNQRSPGRTFSLETALASFSGSLAAMVLCALLAVQMSGTETQAGDEAPGGELAVEDVMPVEVSPALFAEDGSDVILESYRNLRTRERVIEFFTQLCGSREVAMSVLVNAAAFHISPSLAFSLAWEESRYKTTAVNRKNANKSIDRGLFQLNNRSFPKLTEDDFFKTDTNAWYAMNHLRWCLDSGGTEVAALAMYNAGTGRVKADNTPKRTLDYAARILKNRGRIEDRFEEALPWIQAPEAIGDFAKLSSSAGR